MRGTHRRTGTDPSPRARAAAIAIAAALALIVGQSALVANAVTGPLGRDDVTVGPGSSSSTTPGTTSVTPRVPPPDVPELTIVKVADGASTTDTFSFSAGPDLNPDSFDLKPGTGDNSKTYNNVPAGSYTITETSAESGWGFQSASCDNDNYDSVQDGVTVTVGEAGSGDVTCTFTNVPSEGDGGGEGGDACTGPPQATPVTRVPFDLRVPVLKGCITIVKVAEDAGPGDGFTFSSEDFEIPPLHPGNHGGQDEHTIHNVDPGSYTITEDAVDGWELQSASCDNESQIGDRPLNGVSNGVVANVSTGEHVTCTFTNIPSEGDGGGDACTGPPAIPQTLIVQSQPGCITIVKVAEDAGPGDAFTFSSEDFEIPPLHPGNHGGQDEHTIQNVDPGSYTITEDAVDGWELQSASCDNESQIGDRPLISESDGVVANVSSGEHVTCTFTNILGEVSSDVTITKEGPDEIAQGGTIEYTITVHNHQLPGAPNLEITDDLPDEPTLTNVDAQIAGGVANPSCEVTTDGTNVVTCDFGLASVNSPNDTAVITITATVETGECLDLENVATGTQRHGRETVDLEPSEGIDTEVTGEGRNCGGQEPPPGPGGQPEPAPTFEFTKSGPEQAHVGDTITYTFGVSVTNGVDAHDVSISDPLCDPGTLSGPTGDDGDGVLEPGETWTFQCTHLVTGSDPDPLLNTATVSGENGDGAEGRDQDQTETDILHPGIDVELDSDPNSGHPGDNVDWMYMVTNTGDTPLFDIFVMDDLFGDVGSQDQLGPFRVPMHGALDPGDSVTFTKGSTIPDQTGPIEDTAVATGQDALGLEVSDTDGQDLGIVLGKTVTPTKTPPGGLAFTGGAAVIPLALLALLFLLLGSGLLWASRNRGKHAAGPDPG